MTVYRQGKSWRVVVDSGTDEHGKRLRTSETVRGTKADAQRRERELLTAIDKGAPINTSKITLGEHLDDWLRRKEARVALKTSEDYHDIIRCYLKPRLGNVPISKLTPRHVEELHRYMGNKGLSARSVQYTHRILSQALKYAVKMEILARNVCNVVDPPKLKRKEIHVMDTDNVQIFLEATRGNLYWPVFFLAIYTGLRRGEVLGLRWQDLNIQNGTISVNQVVNRIRGKGLVIGEPKTASSRRLVSLPASASRLLIDLKLKEGERLESIGMGWNASALIFSNVDGGPLSPSTVSHNFSKALKKAGLPHMRFHDLRHTHATLMLEQGIHPKVVSERLGHSSINITLDTYSHVLPGMQDEAVQVFEQALQISAFETEPVNGHNGMALKWH